VIKNMIIIFSLITMTEVAWANDRCKELNLGWHFFCDTKKREDPKITPEQAQKQLQQIQEDIEQAKAQAVIYPTEENISKYLELQNQIMERSVKFAHVWQNVLRARPDLDYRVVNPQSNIGNEARYAIAEAEKLKILKNLHERYGLFYFYRSDCPYCIKFSPIIKSFGEYYGITIMPITINGITTDEWPESRHGMEHIRNLGMEGKPVPALILFDNLKKQHHPVSFGLIPASDIEDRLVTVINNIENEEEIK
jgi:conjugal transfer pilus assembly protein TraF